VLHGLASYSLISKKTMDRRIEFRDLMGSMLNLQGDDDQPDSSDDI
jgi:magnesium chelatase subunit I